MKPWLIQSFLTFDSMDRTPFIRKLLSSTLPLFFFFWKIISFEVGTVTSERVFVVAGTAQATCIFHLNMILCLLIMVSKGAMYTCADCRKVKPSKTATSSRVGRH